MRKESTLQQTSDPDSFTLYVGEEEGVVYQILLEAEKSIVQAIPENGKKSESFSSHLIMLFSNSIIIIRPRKYMKNRQYYL